MPASQKIIFPNLEDKSIDGLVVPKEIRNHLEAKSLKCKAKNHN